MEITVLLLGKICLNRLLIVKSASVLLATLILLTDPGKLTGGYMSGAVSMGLN